MSHYHMAKMQSGGKMRSAMHDVICANGVSIFTDTPVQPSRIANKCFSENSCNPFNTSICC